MRHLILVLLVATACGKDGVGWECSVDADCEQGLSCGTLQAPDGAKRSMCVNSDGAWDVTAMPKKHRSIVLPIGVGAGGLVLLLMLRASVIAREKRKRAKSAP